ncbi:hypothetical protein [Ralstonia pseudosolanacearum]|uniref:DUF4365 domain-containing protein n=1 Tax=Ralstonia solanacearum TaxID=305 RepID=A0A0S4WF66_RALSL|nr:conserved protein of unknown function [Ralstonia solanacearum]
MNNDAIGARGESIFFTRITALHGGSPLFKPAFLGDKWAVADYVVELEGKTGCYFLVQVKATTSGLNKLGNLPVSVRLSKYQKLQQVWVPSYVVGVDDSTEDAYICATSVRTAGLSSLKTQYPLRDPVVRQQLHDEVLTFWQRANAMQRPWTSRLY